MIALFVFLSVAIKAQIYVPPHTEGVPEKNTKPEEVPLEQKNEVALTPNEYASRYKEAPRKPATNITWFANPQQVASRIPLGQINVYVRRFEDDKPYLEKTVNDTKGRIFLKETRGVGYRIYDIMFVPYIPLHTKYATTQIQKENEETSLSEEKQKTTKEKEEIKTRIPTYAERNTGKSLFVEIHIFRANGALDSLVRYEGEQVSFSESYQYTSKGALRTLTRKYRDDSLVRFVYYFSDGGLEEEFHQNADKSISYKKYTRTGLLKESARYNSEGTLEYKIMYRFDKNNNIESEEEITAQSRYLSTYKNAKKQKTVLYEKNKTKDNKETETITSTVQYEYHSNETSTAEKNAKFLHEKNSESFFDKSGTLVKKREYVDFVLTKEIKYAEQDVRIETQFHKGKPVLEIRYVGSRKEYEKILP